EPRVEVRHIRVVELDVTGVGPPDLNGGAQTVRSDLLAAVVLHHYDLKSLSLALGPSGDGFGPRGRTRDLPAPSDVDGHRADRSIHEEVDEGQERILEDREHERGNRGDHKVSPS